MDTCTLASIKKSFDFAHHIGLNKHVPHINLFRKSCSRLLVRRTYTVRYFSFPRDVHQSLPVSKVEGVSKFSSSQLFLSYIFQATLAYCPALCRQLNNRDI